MWKASLAALSYCLFAAAPVHAATQNNRSPIIQEGRLFDDKGRPVQGQVVLDFAVYESATALSPLFKETHTVSLLDGRFTVALGSVVPFGDKVWDGSARFVGVTVQGDVELKPRQILSAVPAALAAAVALDAVGDLHPLSISVGGKPIVGADGSWVGPPLGGSVIAPGAIGREHLAPGVIAGAAQPTLNIRYALNDYTSGYKFLTATCERDEILMAGECFVEDGDITIIREVTGHGHFSCEFTTQGTSLIKVAARCLRFAPAQAK